MTRERTGKTDSGRVVLTTNGEEPCTARRSKRHYQLWKLAQDLELYEIRFLISKRKNDLLYEENKSEILNLKTDILILEDTYKIKKRKINK